MYLVEKIAKSITSNISKNLKLNSEKEQVITYGAFALIQITFCILLTIIFSIIFNVLMEAIIISFIGNFLRKYSGGAHASSPGRCACIGTAVNIGLAIICKFIGNHENFLFILVFNLICFAYSYHIILKLAPVDSESKPITKPETKLILRKKSIFVLNCLLIISSVLLFFYYRKQNIIFYNITLSIILGMTWQSFTLSAAGDKLIIYIDNILKKIF